MSCPDFETLFFQVAEGQPDAVAHAEACPSCCAKLDQHQALEHELFKCCDPMPPSGFVPGVMARIAASPAPVRREIWAGVTVLFASVGAAVTALFSIPHAWGRLGVGAAHAANEALSLAGTLPAAVSTVWHHAAIPAALFCTLLMACLYGLKKLAGTPALSDTKVSA